MTQVPITALLQRENSAHPAKPSHGSHCAWASGVGCAQARSLRLQRAVHELDTDRGAHRLLPTTVQCPAGTLNAPGWCIKTWSPARGSKELGSCWWASRRPLSVLGGDPGPQAAPLHFSLSWPP